MGRKRSGFIGSTREAHLLSKYGITEEAYNALLETQNFGCKLCNQEFADKSGKRKLCVDHDHKTGRIRGLLCISCNRMLGYAADNPVTLLKAIQYLKGNLL